MEKKPKRIAVDFDSTLAFYTSGPHYDHTKLGRPIPAMVEKVKKAIAEGAEVEIFTARVNPGITHEHALKATESYLLIAEWSKKHLGKLLPITYCKSPFIEQYWDDRARGVVENEGEFTDEFLIKHYEGKKS